MFGRIFLILTCSILPTKRLVANDSIDSLYREALTTNHFDYKQANRLMLMLDVEGVTDSLMTFDSNTDKQEMMASVHFYVSTYYFEVAQRMTAAIKAAQRAEAIAREACDTPMIVEALSTQSVAAIRTGQMESALRTAKEELRIDQLTGDIANLSRAYNILAALSLQGNRLDDAEKYILKAIEMERCVEDSSHLSMRYGIATEIFTKRGEYDRAYEFGERAYEMDRSSGDKVKAARRLSQISDIYMAQGKYSEAETFCQRAIAALREAEELTSLSITLKQLGQIYLKQNLKQKAYTTLKECEDICRATEHHYILQQVCRMQAEALGNDNPRQALAYLQEALQLSDSLHTERAEQLANEIREGQYDELAAQPAEEKSRSTARAVVIIVLLDLLALTSIWISFRRKTGRKMMAEAEMLVERQGEHIERIEDQDLEFLVKVTELYEKSLDKQRLNVDELSAAMNMSRSQFTRRIVATTGSTPNNYFNRLRLEKAARLLKNSERSINSVAYECGFEDTPYFCNLFKKYFKVTPMQYRVMPEREKK